MNEKVLKCIPSLTLRSYLTIHPIDLSIMQEATIVSEYASKEVILSLFEEMLNNSNKETDNELLLSAIEDIKNYGYIGENTNRIYKDKIMVEKVDFPICPFLENCFFPVLFNIGDLITNNVEIFVVAGLPYIVDEKCDFSDECYLCYPLSINPKDSEDLFLAHEHIHVCNAEVYSINQLTEQHNKSLQSIKKLLKI